MRSLLFCLVAAVSLAVSAAPGDTIRFALPGWVELELVEVGGTSRLPLQYLYRRQNRETLTEVSAPTYWIGKYEVTRKQYKAVMGEDPSAGLDDRLPVAHVKWKDAVEFCDRLNQVVHGEIPFGYRFDLPTIIEWAHAYSGGTTNVFRYSGSDDLDAVAWHGVGKEGNAVEYGTLHLPGLKLPNAVGAYDMSGNVAEYVFIADTRGGSIRMGGSYMWPERYCELGNTAGVVQDGASPDLGFRVVLVQTGAKELGGRSSAMGTKGRVLLRSACVALARKYLSIALEQDGLSNAEAKLLNDDWVKADKACGYDVGTWQELLAKLSETLGRFGYQVEDYFRFWDADPRADDYEELRIMTRRLYRQRGVCGMRMEARDLPKEISSLFASSPPSKVQVALCDFTGDGLKDLVVELPGHTDSNGVQYGFFERIQEGGYRLVGEPIRTAGLCIIPTEQNKVVCLTLIKRSNDLLTPGVIDCVRTNGKSCLTIGWPFERSFCLCDQESLKSRLPFVGKGSQDRKQNRADDALARPLCWPWR